MTLRTEQFGQPHDAPWTCRRKQMMLHLKLLPAIFHDRQSLFMFTPAGMAAIEYTIRGNEHRRDRVLLQDIDDLCDPANVDERCARRISRAIINGRDAETDHGAGRSARQCLDQRGKVCLANIEPDACADRAAVIRGQGGLRSQRCSERRTEKARSTEDQRQVFRCFVHSLFAAASGMTAQRESILSRSQRNGHCRLAGRWFRTFDSGLSSCGGLHLH